MPPVHVNPFRFYRCADALHVNEQKFQVILGETDLWITTHTPWQRARDISLAAARKARGMVAAWCEIMPAFRHSLCPLPEGSIPDDAPVLIRRMDEAGRAAGVGPFAAVAGAIAQAVADEMAEALVNEALPRHVLVENGGDCFLYSERERVAALMADPHGEERDRQAGAIGLHLDSRDFPVALCASSAVIGPSLSFGHGELAVVRSHNGSLADAMATAYGNMLKGPEDVERVLEQAARDAHHGVEGVFVQCAGRIGIWGNMELTALAGTV